MGSLGDVFGRGRKNKGVSDMHIISALDVQHQQHTMLFLHLYLHTDTLFLHKKSMGSKIKNKRYTTLTC